LSHSQTPSEWKNWFPLKVGNFWQYKIEQDFLSGFLDWYIPRDSVAGNEHWFLLREHSHSLGGNVGFSDKFVFSNWVRYDDSTRSVVALERKNGITSQRIWRYFTYKMVEEPFFVENLKFAQSNSLLDICSRFDSYYYAEKEILISQDAIKDRVLARSCWRIVLGVGASLVHNIGLFREGGCEGSCSEILLVYAKVNGKEYGIRKIVGNEIAVPASHNFVLHSVFPNPFVDEVGLVWEADSPAIYRIRMFNPLGREVMVQDLGWKERGLQKITLGIRHLPNGIYLIQLINNKDQTFQKRLIKQK